MTYADPDFNVDNWCEYDANILKKASDFIYRELKDAPPPEKEKSHEMAPIL